MNKTRAKPNLTPEGIEARRQGLLKYYAIHGRSPEWGQHISESKKGKPSIEKGKPKPTSRYLRSKKTRQRMSEGRKRMLAEHPELLHNLSRKLTGRVISQKTRDKQSRIRREYIETHPEAIEILSDSRRGKPNKQFSDTVKRLWKKGYYAPILIAAWNVKPNKQEMLLGQIIDEVCPDMFEYNGDYRLGVSLNKCIPDFVNTNGKKQVIEFFGSYWHKQSGRGEQEKIAKYREVGWNCLVVWDSELKDTGALKAKIRAFGGGNIEP